MSPVNWLWLLKSAKPTISKTIFEKLCCVRGKSKRADHRCGGLQGAGSIPGLHVAVHTQQHRFEDMYMMENGKTGGRVRLLFRHHDASCTPTPLCTKRGHEAMAVRLQLTS